MNHNYSVTYEDIKLIPMDINDSEKYRLIRNMPEIRCWFEHSSVISAKQQEEWYMRYLNSPNEVMFSAYLMNGGGGISRM